MTEMMERRRGIFGALAATTLGGVGIGYGVGIAEQERRIAELENALKPFLDLFSGFDAPADAPDDAVTYQTVGKGGLRLYDLTIGDLRRARAAYRVAGASPSRGTEVCEPPEGGVSSKEGR